MDIAIIGTRGIPAAYGGFETCVEETSVRFRADGHSVRVYCRAGKTGTSAQSLQGITLHYLPYVNGKHLETVTHTLFSVLHLLVHPAEVVQIYGAGNGWSVPVLRFRGSRVVFLIDGVDWKRAKWGRFARWMLRLGARIGSRFANHIVADSLHVKDEMSGVLGRRQVDYVPYGAKIIPSAKEGKLRSIGVSKGSYFLFVGRFVPEKNIHLLVKAFAKASVARKLVIVGGSSYDRAYEDLVRGAASESVIFTGFVFGREYEELLMGCYVYVQPSALEGTSPALLAAMGAGACVLASDIPENKETVGDAGFFFASNDEADLSRWIVHLDSAPEKVEAKKEAALQRVMAHYSWERVAARLLELSSEIRNS